MNRKIANCDEQYGGHSCDKTLKLKFPRRLCDTVDFAFQKRCWTLANQSGVHGTSALPWNLSEVWNLVSMPDLPGDLYAQERLRNTVLESYKKVQRL